MVIEIDGKYVIKNITIASTAKNGNIAFDIVSTLSPETEDATNNTKPIGGCLLYTSPEPTRPY